MSRVLNMARPVINLLLVSVARGRIIVYYREFLHRLHYLNLYLLFSRVRTPVLFLEY
jgi:hypothetical protein